MTREQAEGVVNILAEVVDESIRRMEAGLVSKEDVEKVRPISAPDTSHSV